MAAKTKLSPMMLLLLLAAAFGALGIFAAGLLSSGSSSRTTPSSAPTLSIPNVWEGVTGAAGSMWDSVGKGVDWLSDLYTAATSSSSSSSSALPAGVESDPLSDPYGESRETS